MHQQRLAGFQAAALDHIVPDGEGGLRDGRGLDHRQCADRQRVAFMRQAVFGVAAAADQRHDAVAGLPARHIRPDRHDFAGDLETGDVGSARRRRVETLALRRHPAG